MIGWWRGGGGIVFQALFVPRPLRFYFLEHGGEEAPRLLLVQLIGGHFSSRPHNEWVNGLRERGRFTGPAGFFWASQPITVIKTSMWIQREEPHVGVQV